MITSYSSICIALPRSTSIIKGMLLRERERERERESNIINVLSDTKERNTRRRDNLREISLKLKGSNWKATDS